jgi:hypothetical protein
MCRENGVLNGGPNEGRPPAGARWRDLVEPRKGLIIDLDQ